MEATFTVTEDDYVKAARLHARSSSTLPIIIGSMIAGFVLMIGLEYFGVSARVGECLSFMLVPAAFILLWCIFGGPIMLRRHYRQYKLIHDPLTIQMEEAGIRARSDDYDTIIRWEKALKWRHDDSFILIYLAPQFYQVVPKSLAEQGFDVDLLLQALEEKVGKAS